MSRGLTRRKMIIESASALGTLAVAPAFPGCTMVASPGRRKIRSNCDAIVIGTGFGAAVLACRLAQAGLSVAVLERGRRYDHGPFPRNWNNPSDGWLWSSDQGLFDVKLCQEITVLQAAGLGGGSLICENVQMRAPAAVLTSAGPAATPAPLSTLTTIS